jgi:hypothetical protein
LRGTEEYRALTREMKAIEKALPKTPSKAYSDLAAKLRHVVHHTPDDNGDTSPSLTGFLKTLGPDHEQLLDRLDEQEAEAINAMKERAA